MEDEDIIIIPGKQELYMQHALKQASSMAKAHRIEQLKSAKKPVAAPVAPPIFSKKPAMAEPCV